ncbi:MAG: PAS domain S-box protein, partial [Deltaproteobacteria bacterium]|nr:PAS domain S-box protein [Deltaproteobacteria bacterium]
MPTTSNKPISLKLHRRIILTFILTTVFAILLVGSTLRYVLEKTTIDNWKKRQEFVTLEFAPQCDFEIQQAQRDLEFVSKMAPFSELSHIDQIDPSIKGIPENVDVEKREMFRDLMALGERFSSLIILTPNANLYLVHPFKTQIKVKRLNFADRAYFKEAVRTKRPVISDSFVSAAGNPVVVIAVPVLNKAGDITAIIVGGVYLTNLSQLIDKKRIGAFDLGFIVDRKGRLIAHTNTKLLKKEIRDRYIEHALVSKFLHKSPQDDSKVMIEDCVDPVDGKHYLTSFVKLKSGWGLGLALSRETILSEIRPAVWRITILVSLIILLVGTIGVFFAQWIGRRWIGTEKTLVKQTHDLGERVKELDSLYRISKVVEKPDISLEEIFQGIAEIIPHSYQYPEITCSRIVMTDKEYKTKNFKETEWKQSSEIFVTGNQIGTLEVFYLEEKPEIYEGPFLKEERNLIDEIADRLRMIIERKQVEEALEKSESRFREMFEQSPFGIALIGSLTGHIYELNPKFAEIAGRRVEKMRGIDWMSITHPDDVQEDLDNMDLLNAGKITGFNMDKRYIRPDGSHVWINMTIAPVAVEDKTHPRHLCMIDDVTAQKEAAEERNQLQEKLQRAQKMEAMGLMAGGVAHDLNNILSGIVSYPELLLMDIPEDSPMWKPIKTIQESGMRAADVVEDLLTIARGVATSREALNLNTLITEYLGSAEYEKLEKTHSFVSCRTELDPDLLNMSGS